MGRKARVEYYGAIYHITHRGKDDFNIFMDDGDKVKFLGILAEAKEIFEFKLIAYCIMDDRYNLVLKFHNIPISTVLQWVHMMYARYINNKYKRSGSPFQGRYKADIVHNEKELLSMVKEVHNYPVLLNKVDELVEYKWSSDIFIRMNLDSLVDIDYILDILSDDRQAASNKYKELMSEGSEDNRVLNKIYVNKDNIQKNNLDIILSSICPNPLDYDLIKNGSKKSYLMKLKQEYIKECSRLGFSNFEISLSIGITERTVRNYL